MEALLPAVSQRRAIRPLWIAEKTSKRPERWGFEAREQRAPQAHSPCPIRVVREEALQPFAKRLEIIN